MPPGQRLPAHMFRRLPVHELHVACLVCAASATAREEDTGAPYCDAHAARRVVLAALLCPCARFTYYVSGVKGWRLCLDCLRAERGRWVRVRDAKETP